MKKKPTEKNLKEALSFMKSVGLVPTGHGKHTKPSMIPSFELIQDNDDKVYYLHTNYEDNKGDLWELNDNGDSYYLGSTKGKFKVGKNQIHYDDSEFRDYVSLKVIQEVYGLLDPNFDRDEDYSVISKQSNPKISSKKVDSKIKAIKPTIKSLKKRVKILKNKVEKFSKEPEKHLLLDENRGIYIPKKFAENHDMKEWHVHPRYAKILLEGPDSDDYFDVWDVVLREAYFIDSKTKKKYCLEQDGDLFVVEYV